MSHMVALSTYYSGNRPFSGPTSNKMPKMPQSARAASSDGQHGLRAFWQTAPDTRFGPTRKSLGDGNIQTGAVGNGVGGQDNVNVLENSVDADGVTQARKLILQFLLSNE